MSAPLSPAAVLDAHDWGNLQAGTPAHVLARADLAALNAAGLDALLRDPACCQRLRMMATSARDRLSAPRQSKATDDYIARRNAARAPLAAFVEEV